MHFHRKNRGIARKKKGSMAPGKAANFPVLRKCMSLTGWRLTGTLDLLEFYIQTC